jgi:hypothetical protein
MRAITVSVPPEGLTVSLKVRSGATSAEAVVVVPDNVEVSAQHHPPAEPSAPPGRKAPPHDVRFVVERLRKLKVKTTAAAINSIKAMFQFTEPLTDDDAKKRLSEAQRKGFLRIDTAGKISFRDA